MLFYLFSAEELGELFERLGYTFDPASIPKTIAYYHTRTAHGSTLCRVTMAWVFTRSEGARAGGRGEAYVRTGGSDTPWPWLAWA